MNSVELDVLLVEDNPADVFLLREALAQDALAVFRLTVVDSLAAAHESLTEYTFAAALLDLSLPDSHGLETFLKFHQTAPDLPVVVLSALDDQDIAMQALQAGAQDYLVKRPQEFAIVGQAVRYAIERQKFRQSQQDSEQLFLTAFHSSPACQMITTLPDGLILDVNEAFCRLVGYERDELINHTTQELEFWAEVEEREAAFQAFRTDGRISNREVVYRTRSGEHRQVIASVEPIEIKGLPCVISTSLDITERKQAEEKLRASERKLRLISENTTDFIFAYDMERRLLYANPAIEQLTGYSHRELQESNFINWLHPEDEARMMKLLAGVFAGQGFSGEEFRIITKDGQVKWSLSTWSPMLDEAGRQIGVQGRETDITARKQAEEQLRESEERLRLILQTTSDGFWVVDSNRKFRDVNNAYCAMSGYTHEELLQLTISDLEVTENAQETDQRIKQIIREGKDRFETRHRRKDGSEFDAEVTVNTFDKEQGLLLAFCRDITARKLADAAVQRLATQRQLALDAANLGWWSYDPLTRIAQWDDGYQTIFGVTGYTRPNDEILQEIIHPDDLPSLWAKVEAALDPVDPQPYATQYRIRRANDGQVRWIEACGIATFTGKGQARRAVNFVGTVADITERKQADEKLRESEARFYSIVENSPIAIGISRVRDQKIVNVNAAFINLYGFTLQEIIGHTTQELNLWSDHTDRQRFMEQLRTQSHVSALEVTARLKSGQERQVLVWGELIELGNEPHMMAQIIDITERKQAEEKLRESEEKYRSLLASLDSVVTSVDESGHFLYANEMAARQLGMSVEILVGKTMPELFPEPVATRQLENIRKVIREDRAMVTEAPSLVQGQPRWYRNTLQPVHDHTGRVAYALINAVDIHDLKTAQQRLEELNRTLEERIRQATAEMQDLYDNAPAGYHSLDENGTIVRVNQTELNWLGYTAEEVLGRPFVDFTTPAGQATLRKNFPQFKQRGWVNELEFEMVRKDGSILPVLVSGTAIYDEQGNYVMSRSTMFDITERKKAEAALRLANAELARAARAKDEFLANTSHELRTPLNAILGLSELLQEQIYGPLNQRQFKAVGTIAQSGNHLLALINDILDLSKVEAGRMELLVETAPVAEICQASLVFVKELAQKKQLRLTFRQDDPLATIQADATRLKQMLVNLLGNAVKFTPEGGQVSLAVTTDAETGVIRFVVQDTGIGIAPEDLARLFQPFTQVDASLNREHEGTGLGLALVRRLAELHGGGVTVDSTVGQGSCFTIVLPYQPVVAAAPETAPPLRPGVLRSALMVEDSASEAEQLARYLQETNIQVTIHPRGEGVVELAARLQPDVILLDLQLPNQSGWTVLAQLKADPRTRAMPVIIISIVDERAKGIAAGAARYLVKPVSRDDLWQAMRAAVLPPKPTREDPVIVPPDETGSPGARILLAEDNEANILTTHDYLRGRGYRVVVARNGQEALDLAADAPPDLILMDIQMPGLDGLEAIRRLRVRPECAAMPIIALTALAMPGDRERCLTAGANEYLTKPVSLKYLAQTIEMLLKS